SDTLSETSQIDIPSPNVLQDRLQYKSMSPKIFISYSHEDADEAEEIKSRIENRGLGTWFDVEDIEVGESIAQKIAEGISRADLFVVLLSKSSVRSGWVEDELNQAKTKENIEGDVFILPLLLEDCEIPRIIGHKKYADGTESYEEAVSDVMSAVQTHLDTID
ncbi:MAG: toll/interleukin-1 receptor domain-containing protein, partial [Halobacteriaceae archaeon]